MAVTLDGTGGIFTRIGQIAKTIRMFNGSVNGTAPSNASAWGTGGPTIINYKTVFDAIQDQYEAALQGIISPLYPTLEAFRLSGASMKTSLKGIAEQTLIEQVNADTPLVSKTVDSALRELIRQMTDNSDSVKANTVSAAAASAGGTNIGNAVITASVVGKDGLNMEFVFPETLKFTVTSDELNGATEGQEPIAVSGATANTDQLSYLWPQGSGLTGGSLTMVNNVVDGVAASTGHMLTNSEFETYTVANTPDNWSLTTGSFGTSILKSTAGPRKGSANLQIVGDGAELTDIYQQFNNGSGTLSIIKPSRVYAFSAWVKMSATPSTGVLAFELTDGSNVLLADDAATNNAITQDLTAVSTSWVNVRGFFRTKKTFAGVARLRIRLTTAIETGKSLHIDDVAMAEATQLYAGGPHVAAFRGTVDVITGDYWTIAISNNMSAAGTAGGVLQTTFEQLFQMRAKGLQIPSDAAAGETVADTLAF